MKKLFDNNFDLNACDNFGEWNHNDQNYLLDHNLEEGVYLIFIDARKSASLTTYTSIITIAKGCPESTGNMIPDYYDDTFVFYPIGQADSNQFSIYGYVGDSSNLETALNNNFDDSIIYLKKLYTFEAPEVVWANEAEED